MDFLFFLLHSVTASWFHISIFCSIPYFLPVSLYLQLKLHSSLILSASTMVPAPSISPAQLPCRRPRFNYCKLCDNPRPLTGHCRPPLNEESRGRQEGRETRGESVQK